MSDSEVARRVGMTQRRYSSYVNMTREPNFSDLLRICEGLAVTPDYVLGVTGIEPGDDAGRRVAAALAQMPAMHRTLAVAAVEGMAGAVLAPAEPPVVAIRESTLRVQGRKRQQD